MARVDITTAFTSVSSRGATYTPIAANADGHSFTNNGKRFVLVENSNAATRDVTAVHPGLADVNLAVPDRVVTVPVTTGRAILGPFGPEYNQPDGKVHINYEATAGLTVTFCELA